MTDEHTSIAGSAYGDLTITEQTVSRIVAEARALELLEALGNALIGAPHWRHEAQALLRKIGAGEMPEPKGRY